MQNSTCFNERVHVFNTRELYDPYVQDESDDNGEDYPLSKTIEMGRSMEASQIPGETEAVWHGSKGFTVLDTRYLIPIFRKK